MKGQSGHVLDGQVSLRGGRHFLGWDMYHCTEGWRGDAQKSMYCVLVVVVEYPPNT